MRNVGKAMLWTATFLGVVAWAGGMPQPSAPKKTISAPCPECPAHECNCPVCAKCEDCTAGKDVAARDGWSKGFALGYNTADREWAKWHDENSARDESGGGYVPNNAVRFATYFGGGYVDGAFATAQFGAYFQKHDIAVLAGPYFAHHHGTPVDFSYYTRNYRTVQIPAQHENHFGVGAGVLKVW